MGKTFILKILGTINRCLDNTLRNMKLLQIVCLILFIKIEEIHNGKNVKLNGQTPVSFITCASLQYCIRNTRQDGNRGQELTHV